LYYTVLRGNKSSTHLSFVEAKARQMPTYEQMKRRDGVAFVLSKDDFISGVL
jgi:hypothetical protein